MIDRIRYFLGVMGVITLPPGALFWIVIHPWAHQWRRLGPTRTYLIIVPVLVAFGALLYPIHDRLLGADLGRQSSLIAIAAVLYAGCLWLELRYWKHLSLRIAIGIPELSGAEHGPGKLLQEGMYRVVRHPRYLSAGLGVIANTLIINYTGMYVIVFAIFVMGHFLLAAEERELVDRFGDAYRRYQREVPSLIPRWRR